MRGLRVGAIVRAGILLVAAAACSPDPTARAPQVPTWEVVAEADARGMWMSMWGAAGDDAWIVGGTLQDGGVAVRAAPDGTLTDVPLPDNTAMLTWVHGRAADDVWIAGLFGTLLHWDGAEWSDHGMAIDEAFWGVHAGPEGTVVAVGGPFRQVGSAPVIARGDRTGMQTVAMPGSLSDFTANLFKVHHDGEDGFLVVGAQGVALSVPRVGEAAGMATGTTEDLVTVHGEGDDLLAVGGRGMGSLFERTEDGTGWTSAQTVASGASGVHRVDDAVALVVGESGFGGLWNRADGTFEEADPATFDLLHAAWVDPDDRMAWAVGGNWVGSTYTGVVLRGSL